MEIIPVGTNTPVASWTIENTDPISTVGCNRYGMFADQEIWGLPIDNAKITGGCATIPTPEVGVIAPTATTCSMYRDGTAPALVGGLQYTSTKTKSGSTVINAVSPGVFFYYTKFSGDAGDAVVITQTNDGTPAPYAAIPVMQGQVVLYDAVTCAKMKWGAGSGFNLPSPGGNYIIGVKYDASSLKGKTPSTSQPVTYSFDTTVHGDLVDTGASVELAAKH
jgi:hypothetical protein